MSMTRTSVEFLAPHGSASGMRKAIRVIVLLLPAGLLFVGGLRSEGIAHQLLWAGSAVVLALAALLFVSTPSWLLPQMGMPVIALYLTALLWLWVCTGSFTEWFPHFAQAVLLVVPLLLYAAQTLVASGAPAYRRARQLAERLRERADWPHDLAACRTLPEVKALREAIQVEPAPALELLSDSRPQVQLAALTALEFRKHWPAGQADLIVHFAARAREPLVRAAAVMALGNVDSPVVVEAVAAFLSDPAAPVRQAAAEALMWDTDRRWPWIRSAVYTCLSDPRFSDEGPLPGVVTVLPPGAVADLTAWSSEGGALSQRATQTLVAHYHRAMQAGEDRDLPERLRHQMMSGRTPIVLRIELSHLLRDHQLLSAELMERMLDPAQPSPLRLLAAEALLGAGPNPAAVEALREIARHPNREIALTTAMIVQRCLGVDFGLSPHSPPPALQSRQAAEVTRRVMLWAATPAPERTPDPKPPAPADVPNASSPSSADWGW
jgi:hypothetical protein